MNLVVDPITYIHALGRFSGKAGLHRIFALLQALGNPQKQLRFVHIAGTNGKGSTAAMTAGILQRAGYRTGLFTSPFLVVFHERIRVDGEMISGTDLQRLTSRVAEAAKTLLLSEGESIGEFEFVTAVGMLYFLEKQCDLVVLETGLGGEFDASNAIDPPLVAAITSVSLDHTAVLGNTLTQIARAKAGIIKTGSMVVCAPHQYAEVVQVIRDTCAERSVPCVVPEEAEILSCDLHGTQICYVGREYFVGMIGRHQVKNALTALHIIGALREKGFLISEDAVRAGLAETRFAGRLEKVCDAPLVILDGAHNPDGVRALCNVLEELLQGRKLHMVLGMVRDKAVEACVRELAAHAAAVFTAAPDNERALDSASAAKLAAEVCGKVQDCNTVENALRAALDVAGAEDCVLVCGSLYLVGEAKIVMESRQKSAE